MRTARWIAAVGAAAIAPVCGAQYSFTPLGVLPGDDTSVAYDVSSDGLIAVGYSNFPFGTSAAFRWTDATGMQDLGTLGGSSEAWGVSGDGSVIVGGSGAVGWRWTKNGGMLPLPLPPGWSIVAPLGVSADGNAAGGQGTAPDGTRAFIWTKTGGSIDIGRLPGASFAMGNAISADGSTVVGRSGVDGNEYVAFRWTQAEGMISLGTLSGDPRAEAWGVNADGSVVVGRSSGDHAFRWTKATGLVDIGKGWGEDATPDGSVIVGSNPAGAAYWTAKTGWVTLANLLKAHGVDLTGWGLYSCYGVSDDGGTLVGWGIFQNKDTRAWIATIPPLVCPPDCDGSGELDIDDFICFQTRYSQGSILADCDKSGELDIDDFICFQTKFGVGCN